MFTAICGAICAAVGAICQVVGALTVLAVAVQGLAKALGIIKPEEKVEEVGDKAIQAEDEGIKPENYNSFEEYKRALDNFEIDPEKSKKISEEDKLRKGLEVMSIGIKDKYPEIDIEKLFDLYNTAPGILTEKKFDELGKMVNADPKVIDNMIGYINGTEKRDSALINAEQALIKMEKAENPKLSDEEATFKAMQVRG